MLKNVWHRAICKEFFSSMAVVAVSAAMIPVMVVPMFEPKVNGYIRSMVTMPRPTSGVRVDVKIELLWTKIVKIHPT